MQNNYTTGREFMKSNGTILLFYKYTNLENPVSIARWQEKLCQKLNLKGRILIGEEGINGTVGGDTEATEAYKKEFLSHPLFIGTDIKESPGSASDFPRLAVKIKKEIVHLGIDPKVLKPSGPETHLTPEQAHQLITKALETNDPNVVILDTRNDYESRIGTFRGATIPPLKTFREFPEYIDNKVEEFKDKTVLMFCTGGVRCERAVSYAQSKGIKNAFQIDGGICRYVEKFPEGHFRGKNYVFDSRIAVKANDDIISDCDLCAQPSNDYTNCMNALCNKHFIACRSCRDQYEYTCSTECQALVRDHKVPVRADRVGI